MKRGPKINDELRYHIAVRYMNCRKSGMTHDDALSELASWKWYSDDGRSKIIGVDAIRKNIELSRKYCISSEEFRASKPLQRDPKWQELIAYLESLN